MLTHRAFKTSPWLRGLFAVLGTMSVEGPVISWVADHRKHHAYADRLGDPHSPHVDHGVGWSGAMRGLAHAHVGWLFDHTQRGARERFAPDLIADPVIAFVDRTFVLWSLVGLAIPFGLGWLIGGTLRRGLQALLWAGVVRIFVLHHVTYSINSLCHFFGRRRFATSDHSRNLSWLAPFSMGEAWHNNHHAFPTSAFHGMGAAELDVSGLVIAGAGARRAGRGTCSAISPERQAAKALPELDGSRALGRRRATIAAMSERARHPVDLSLPPGTAAAGAGCRRSPPGSRSANTRARSCAASRSSRRCSLAAIWALDGQGYFWPAWAWLGLGVLVLLDFTAAWAWRHPPGAVRRVACVWTLVGVAAVILMATWLLTWLLAGAHTFWPAWALLGLATAGSAYSLIALQDRVLVAHGRRALRARIDMLTRTRRQAVDAQAAELRRIERDLHDGAQARLVALTLQLGRAELRVHDQPEVRAPDPRRAARGPTVRSPSCATSPAGSCRRCSPTAAWSRRSSRSPRATASARRSTLDTRRSLAPAVESAAYFVIAEALTNTAKHARRDAQLGAPARRAPDARRDRRRRRLRRRRRRGLAASPACARAWRRSTAACRLRARPARERVVEARLPCG